MGNKKNKNKFDAAFNKTPVAAAAETVGKNNTKRVVLIFVCVLLAAVILFGAILGIVTWATRANYAVRLGSLGISEGVANYFATEFKAEYIRYLNSTGASVTDNEAFWSSPYIGGGVSTSTQGDYLKRYVENSIKELLASVMIFDKYSSLTSDDKTQIANAVDQILTYRAGGSKSEFNAQTEQYGFDYSDFKKGIEMLYKAKAAPTRVFGQNGANITNFSEFCDEFFMGSDTLDGYTRVKVVFIRTQDTFVLDENGKRKVDENGNDMLRDLTAEEMAERNGYIQRLESCIEGFKDNSIAKEVFDEVAGKVYKYNENLTEDYIDYYLLKGSSFTSEFGEKFPEVVDKALSLSVGEVGAVEYGAVMSDADTGTFTGRVYIYRLANEQGAYKRTDSVGFFSDFNSLAASKLYSLWSAEYAEGAEFRSKWYNIDIISHKYTTAFGV